MDRQNRTPEQRHAEYLRTRDACIARAKAWRDANAEHRREYERKRYLEHPDRKTKTIQRAALRRKLHPELRRAEDAKYRKGHKAEITAYNQKYFKEHPDVLRQSQHRRRAQKYAAPFEMFRSLEIYERDGWMCGLCGQPVNKELSHPDPMSASLDHIIPLAKGGHHLRSNSQLAHLSCNKRKNCFD